MYTILTHKYVYTFKNSHYTDFYFLFPFLPLPLSSRLYRSFIALPPLGWTTRRPMTTFHFPLSHCCFAGGNNPWRSDAQFLPLLVSSPILPRQNWLSMTCWWSTTSDATFSFHYFFLIAALSHHLSYLVGALCIRRCPSKSRWGNANNYMLVFAHIWSKLFTIWWNTFFLTNVCWNLFIKLLLVLFFVSS